MKTIKENSVGYIISFDDGNDVYYVGDCTMDGVIFKDEQAFKNKTLSIIIIQGKKLPNNITNTAVRIWTAVGNQIDIGARVYQRSKQRLSTFSNSSASTSLQRAILAGLSAS